MDNSLTANDTPTSNDGETLIQAAVSAVRAGNLSFRAAGKQFGIPPTTISNCFHSCQAPSVAHEHQQLLSNAHKEVIIKWARWHGDMADPLSRVKLCTLIHNLMHRIASNNWIHRFLQKNAGKINARRAHGLDPNRAQAFNPPVVKHHFDQLKPLIVKLGIPLENIYNEDEKGIQLGGGGGGGKTPPPQNIINGKNQRR